MPRHQRHIAAHRRHGPQVHHIGVTRSGQGHIAAVQQVGVGYIQCGRHKPPTGVHHPGFADHNAIGINQIDRPGRRQAPENRGQLPAGHPVQRDARAVVELRSLALVNREGAPVDDAILPRLLDQKLPARRVGDGDSPTDHIGRGRQSIGIKRCGQKTRTQQIGSHPAFLSHHAPRPNRPQAPPDPN